MHRIGQRSEKIDFHSDQVITKIILYILSIHVHSQATLLAPAADPLATDAKSPRSMASSCPSMFIRKPRR
jgi:hypothetical protein